LSKDKYKVKNWSSYTEGLKQRGCLNIWIEQDIAKNWQADQGGKVKRGGQFQYSDYA